jgi:spermidine synthase
MPQQFFEPSGTQFITVSHDDSMLKLVYLDQSYLTSQLVQSELDTERPLHLTAPYSQVMLLSLVWRNDPQRIYIAGLGGGRLPYVLRHYFPRAQIEVTEIDPMIVSVAQQYFGIVLDDHLQVAIADGRAYLERQAENTKYDLILIDVVLGTGYSPYRMATWEFYELCQSRLAPDGVVAVSLFHVEPFFAEKMQTLAESFAQVYLCKLPNGNAVALATNSTKHNLASIPSQARQMQQDLGLSFSLEERAQALELWSGENCDTPILCDDQPPPSYFDLLPHFNTLFSQVKPDLPCPCGSGMVYADCHGKG